MWDSAELWMAIMAVFVAGVFRGFSGFGTGMILVPCLSILYEPIVAVVAVILLEIIPAIQLVPSSIKHCHWKSIIPMSVISLITLPLGAMLLVSSDANTMRLLIGVLVIISVVLLSIGWRFKGEAGLKSSAMTGLSSGVITGATGLGGLPVILYYLSSQLTTKVARASMIVYLVITTVMALVTYALQGIVTYDIMIKSAFVAPVFIFAIWVGGQLFGKVSESFFRAITLSLLGGVGVAMLLT